MPQDIRVIGTGQLLELQRRLRRAGHENIRSSMQRRIRRAAEPLRTTCRTRSAASHQLAGPRAGKRGGRPRRPARCGPSIADAIRISVRTTGNPGARVWVDKGPAAADIPMSVVNRINDGRLATPCSATNAGGRSSTPGRGWWDKTVREPHRPHHPRSRARRRRRAPSPRIGAPP
jgi:hypothetical protein